MRIEGRIMSLINKWNPEANLERMQSEFDELLADFGAEHRAAIGSAIRGDKFVVRIDLPGVDFKNISLHVANGMLKVKASLFRNRIRYGSFEQSINLPEGITAENLNAVHRDGLLELSAPMPKKSPARAINIEVEANTPDNGNSTK